MTAERAARPAFVGFSDGRPVLVVADPVVVEQLGALVARWQAAAVYRGAGTPLVWAPGLVEAARSVVALNDLIGAVPHPEPRGDKTTPERPRWITTTAAAEHLGVSDRAVRKQIETGRLAARKIGGRWLVDQTDLMRAS